jgi:hypothetical protein
MPMGLLLLPTDFFDHGQTICLSQLLLKKECLGCGITRAVQHFIHFDFIQAWKFNKLVVIILPIMAFLWFDQLYKVGKAIKIERK